MGTHLPSQPRWAANLAKLAQQETGRQPVLQALTQAALHVTLVILAAVMDQLPVQHVVSVVM